MTRYPAPSPTYLGPPAHSTPGENKPINRIVIHSTVSPCREGQARSTAAWFRSQAAAGSAHYAVDPGEVIQCAYDSVICWHAPPNTHSLGVEMCEYPSQDKARWLDEPHQRTLRRTARLVAQLCLAYDVPPRYVGSIRLRLGWRGVTTHAAVSQAFAQSSHWDPGAWPRRKFMRLVRAEIKELRTRR